MKFAELEVAGAFVVDCDILNDERGSYVRGWRSEEFSTFGLPNQFKQWNLSRSKRKGTLRGLHWQIEPHAESKLILCVRGEVFDVVVDMRPGSTTFGRWSGVVISAKNRRMIFVPPSCAHGILTLEDESEIFYASTGEYQPMSERGLRFDDAHIGIEWPEEIAVISEKDKRWPSFSEYAKSLQTTR